MASSAASELAAAKSRVSQSASPSFRRLEADVAIQSGLGFFFSRKFRSGVLWSIYQKTGDANAKTAALEQYAKARQAWADLAAVAAPIYKSNVAYGIEKEKHMHGHWTDRLPDIDADIEAMKKGDLIGTPSRPGAAPTAILMAQGRPTRPVSGCQHAAPTTFVAGQELPVVLNAGTPGTKSVRLYYRRVNQAENWQVLSMEEKGDRFHGTIPATYTQTKFPLQYYFGLNKGDSGSALFPGLDSTLANQPYFVVRLKKQV
jgi:hypothetical protein